MERGNRAGGVRPQTHTPTPQQTTGGRKKKRKGRTQQAAPEKSLPKTDNPSAAQSKDSSVSLSARVVAETPPQQSSGWLGSWVGSVWQSVRGGSGEEASVVDQQKPPTIEPVADLSEVPSSELLDRLDQLEQKRVEQDEYIADLQKQLNQEQKKSAKLAKQFQTVEKQNRGYARDLEASGRALDSALGDVSKLKKEAVKKRRAQRDERIVATNNLHKVLDKLESSQNQVKNLSTRLSFITQRTDQLAAMFRHSKVIDRAQKNELVDLTNQLASAYKALEKKKEAQQAAAPQTSESISTKDPRVGLPSAPEPTSVALGEGASLFDEISAAFGEMDGAFGPAQQLGNYQKLVSTLQDKLSMVNQELGLPPSQVQGSWEFGEADLQENWQQLDLDAEDESGYEGGLSSPDERRLSSQSSMDSAELRTSGSDTEIHWLKKTMAEREQKSNEKYNLLLTSQNREVAKLENEIERLKAQLAGVQDKSSKESASAFDAKQTLVDTQSANDELKRKLARSEERIAELEQTLETSRDVASDDYRVVQQMNERAEETKKRYAQTLTTLEDQLAGLLPKGVPCDVSNPEQLRANLQAQMRYSEFGQALLTKMGADLEPDQISVDGMLAGIGELQELSAKQDEWSKKGLQDPTVYVDFWEKFVGTFDPNLKPHTIAPDHLLPNLQAVKDDSERLHKIIDAFKLNGWAQGDDALLSYLEALPSQIKQNKTK